MNKKKIITLAIVLVALVGVLVLVMALPDADEKNGGLQTDNGKDSIKLGELIYSVPSGSIDNITVSYGGTVYSFKKDGKDWICPEKNGIGISNSRITMLVTELCSLRYQDKLDISSVTPADCGITESSDFVSFTSENGDVRISLGADVADSSLCYLMTNLSDDIYMVENESVSLMFASFDEYRNDSFELIDFENITAIDYKSQDIAFSLKKGDSDRDNGDFYFWEMTSPLAMSARDEEVDKLLIKPITEMVISAYASDDGNFASFGIDGSAFVSYTDSKGKVQTILLSPLTENKYYLAIEGKRTVYEVSPSCVPFAKLSLIDICDRQLYLNKQSNLDTVTIKGDGFDHSLKFSDSDVFVDGKKLEDANDRRNAFSYVCGLMADDISTEPLGSEKVKITYRLKNGDEAVLIFADADERYYRVSKNGKPLYLIQKNKISTLLSVIEGFGA